MTSQRRIIKFNSEHMCIIFKNVNEKCMHLICNTIGAVTKIVTLNDNAQPCIKTKVTNKSTTVKYAETRLAI